MPILATVCSMGFWTSDIAAESLPAGWTCDGNCGVSGADGVVTLSPAGNSTYEWISTDSGLDGVGALPGVGGTGSPTNGSTLTTKSFQGTAGAPVQFYFNYVTSDGSGFSDYAWARLLNASGTPVALLFTARTAASGSVVPGFDMPAPVATLTPASIPIIGGAPAWTPLGGDSGQCFDVGCGYTGWARSSYRIPTSGIYSLQIGVTNWDDTFFQSGLAIDGVTIGGRPISAIPEPGTMALFSMGALGLWVVFRRGRHKSERTFDRR
ncbi:MAG TPA: NF038132 family protein [Bryobacteraceae bacterium]|nr:NF038132 family protein [Bryobacteraceae bacterium]